MGARKDGLLEYYPRTDSIAVIPRNRTVPGGLDFDQVINCLYEDREGNIWIGSDVKAFDFQSLPATISFR